MDTELNFNQSLIDLVSQQTALYNPRHPDHKNRNKIDKMWMNIACQLAFNRYLPFVFDFELTLLR